MDAPVRTVYQTLRTEQICVVLQQNLPCGEAFKAKKYIRNLIYSYMYLGGTILFELGTIFIYGPLDIMVAGGFYIL